MAAISVKRPYYPIIYVRGYAGSQSEVEETVATPYMGFNLGSTKVRQRWKGDIERTIFESPLVRLMKDHRYQDIYLEGAEIPPDRRIPAKSIIIYRYYEEVSEDLGSGTRLDIEAHAEGLSNLILSVRDHVCGDDKQAKKDCRVYLVAHSMGGLICRCFLQNPKIGVPEAKRLVDKVFTYATPHNGIDMAILGNVPRFFSRNNADNFNRQKMARYLGLAGSSGRAKAPERVDSLNGSFDPARFFCLVGTNYSDYEVAGGWVARLAGPMSDGLVRIDNATVRSAPRAFVHRSHSGHYGIVNSEEGYQNLSRFLFGDVRVDGVLHIHELTLPEDIQALHEERNSGQRRHELRASYHIETVLAPRAAAWDLHRRTMDEGSAVFRTYKELFEVPKKQQRHPQLFSVFLSKQARRDVLKHDDLPGGSRSLGFGIDLRVMVPQYELDGRLLSRNHYRGGHLFHDKINVEAMPPRGARGTWSLKYGFDSETPNEAQYTAEPTGSDGHLMFAIPIEQPSRPGIKAELRLRTTPWNADG